MSKIPVFISCPTSLNKKQEIQRKIIIDLLNNLNLEPRALGRSDYPKNYPLKEVYVIAKHCAGGLILGFEQIKVEQGLKIIGYDKVKIVTGLSIPTPWNQLEAGILFGLKLPLIVFKEDNIEGGIFDIGTSDLFVHKMPNPLEPNKEEIRQIILKWYAEVSSKYYE